MCVYKREGIIGVTRIDLVYRRRYFLLCANNITQIQMYPDGDTIHILYQIPTYTLL